MSATNGYGTAADLLKSERQCVDVTTPAGRFRVRSPSERQRATIARGKPEELLGRLIQGCTIDGDGHRIFSDADSELEQILELDAGVTAAFEQAFNDLMIPSSPSAETTAP